MKIEDFVLPFEGKLNSENRWVKLSKLIPWEEIEKNYASFFPLAQEPMQTQTPSDGVGSSSRMGRRLP
jgi:hypothetical protein